MKQTVTLKKEKRNIIETIIMIFLGCVFILLGFGVFIISIPLVIIIIGIFLMIGAFGIMAIGSSFIMCSRYKSENIICPYCKFNVKKNYGILKKKEMFICSKCKKIIFIK